MVYTVGFLPASLGERNFPDAMPGATAPSAAVLSPQRHADLALSVPAVCKALLRPCAPGLIGLALLVFLWGLGYKLSLYHHHSGSAARPVAAKLWTGPRAVSLLRAPARSSSGVPAIAAVPQLFPPSGSSAARILFPVLSAARGRRSLLPSRSPPPPALL